MYFLKLTSLLYLFVIFLAFASKTKSVGSPALYQSKVFPRTVHPSREPLRPFNVLLKVLQLELNLVSSI